MEGEERERNSTVDSGLGDVKITWQVSLVNKDFHPVVNPPRTVTGE